MIEHGITTTKAHYWVHVFPLLQTVFWYRVAFCRAYIERHKVVEAIGQSKDGAPTGGGYLIPQDAYFVRAATIAPHYLDHIPDWMALTDREAGLLGQEIAQVLIEHRVVSFPPVLVTALNSRQAQFDATDCQVRWMQRHTVEIKTERKTTSNLFVQKSERGHRVHLTGAGERRVTQFPTLFEDGDA